MEQSAYQIERDPRWADIAARAKAPDPSFVYAVKTTGIYCRTDCPSRRPSPKNVEFFDTPQLAEAQGYRPCRRCRPNQISLQEETAAKIAAACERIRTAEQEPCLEELAFDSGMSASHFQRTFKSAMGISPKAYAKAIRMERIRDGLTTGAASITATIYDAGFGSSSRFYEAATSALGMTPSRYRRGGDGVRIMFAVGECSLGTILVACSKKGVCAILLGADAQDLLNDLQERFPRAELIGGDQKFDQLIALVIDFVDEPQNGLDLPLDLRGTAFQQRVWLALCEIPVGTTTSYSEIAKRIGSPTSYRAVAQACGANNIAVAIPCHRVVKSDGGLSGYRWGIDRKQSLLKKEMNR